MSEENEGENNQNNALTELEDFDFYFRFIKPLVLELPTEEDRGIGAAWAQKLEQVPLTEEERQQRLNYVKLLLFVLQRGRLSGIFKKQPPSGPLQPFPQGFSILDMGNWMLDQDDAQVCGGGDAGRVPYDIELSNDLREYAASQEIPNFGIQMYYAWSSDDPVNKWLLFDEDKFPQYILDKIKQLNDTKSDEKASVIKKKGCELNLPEKYSKKKVKSPQEIEKSQGRSFHTYMGLVGRMGNFNDKCDDDPEKYQRLEQQRKGKCPRKPSSEKRCPTNAGEAEIMGVEEEYDNFSSGLLGANSQNRPCHCPYPYPSSSPNSHSKGIQPASCPENLPSPIVLRGNNDSCQYSGTKSFVKSPGGQCADYSQHLPVSPTRNSPRQRSSSPVYVTAAGPAEEEVRDAPNECEVCVCTNPPCTCPCPRGGTQGQTRSNTIPAGAACLDPNRIYDKPTKSDAVPGTSNMGPCMNSPKVPQPSTSAACRSNASPASVRSGGVRSPEVVHCYDTQLPHPNLEVYNRGSTWQPCGPPNRQAAQNRSPCHANARENRGEGGTRRVLFENQSPNRNISGACQQHEANGSVLANDPICNDSSPEVVYERTNRPGVSQHPPQNFQSCVPSQNQVQPTCSSPEVVYDKAGQPGPSQVSQNNQSCKSQANPSPASASPGATSTDESISDLCTADLEALISFIRKFKEAEAAARKAAEQAACSQRPQPVQGSTCPQPAQGSTCPQPAQGNTCPQPAQGSTCPQGSHSAQVRQQQPQPAQIRQRQPQSCSPQSQMRSQQSRPAQVCPQQQPAEVCSQPPSPQICPQSSRPNHQVCPQSPRTAQTHSQQPPTSQVCSQQYHSAQVCSPQSHSAQVCSPQSHSAQVCSQQSHSAQVCSQQSQPAQVCSQQSQSARMRSPQSRPVQPCPQQAQPSQVCPQPSRSPQVCPQSSRPAPQPCPQSSRSPHMSSPQSQISQACQQQHQQPRTPDMCQQEAQASPGSRFGSPFAEYSFQASPIPAEPFQPVQIWSNQSQNLPMSAGQDRSPLLTFEEEPPNECTPVLYLNEECGKNIFVNSPAENPEFNDPPIEWLSPLPISSNSDTCSPQPGDPFAPPPAKHSHPPAAQQNGFQEECGFSQSSSSQSSRLSPSRRPEPLQNEPIYNEGDLAPTQGCVQDPATNGALDNAKQSNSPIVWVEPQGRIIKHSMCDTMSPPYQDQEPKTKSCAPAAPSEGYPSTSKNVHHPPHEYDCYPVNENPTNVCDKNQGRYIDRRLERNPYLEASFKGRGNYQKNAESTRCDGSEYPMFRHTV